MDYIKYIRNMVGNEAINLTGVNVLILNDNDEVLLQKRGEFPFKWGLIGGITELGESLEDSAIREAKEETGLSITGLKLLGTTSGQECYMKLPNNDEAYFISVSFYTKQYEGSLLIDNNETLDLKFYSYKSLPDKVPQSHRIIIDKYYNVD